MTDRQSTVTVFGGTGFLGRAIVARLLPRAYAVRIAVRHPERAGRIFGAPRAEMSFRAADVRDESSTAAAIAGAAAVVNAVSLYVERNGATFEAVHVDGAGRVARLCARQGVQRLLHVSGVGAHPRAASRYIRARADGETAAQDEFPATVVVRPSVMFGENDALLTTLVRLIRVLPVFPLFGDGRTRLQPVYVGDVAEAIAALVSRPAPLPVYEFGGPRIFTYRELVEDVAAALSLRRAYVSLPFPAWKALALAAEMLHLPGLTLGQVELMQQDDVVTASAGLRQLDVTATPLYDVLATLASAGHA
jgi:uncharacterized protein YbjT (DUF2867 family)